MPSSFQIKAFINHWLYEVSEHSIHSPFFFDFYTKLVAKKIRPDFPQIKTLRESLLKNQTELLVEDLGAGPMRKAPEKRKMAEIAATSLTPAHYALFYLDVANYIQAKRMIELGTSLGLTSLYLAQKKDAHIITFEGNRSVADAARTNFEWAEQKNIELVEGNIDYTLHRFLQLHQKVDFVLMDANHHYEPTIRYYQQLTKRLYEKSIVIMDDIHRSAEMEKAWNEIKSDIFVYGSVDLYRCGVLFFDPVMNKQHFIWSLK